MVALLDKGGSSTKRAKCIKIGQYETGFCCHLVGSKPGVSIGIQEREDQEERPIG